MVTAMTTPAPVGPTHTKELPYVYLCSAAHSGSTLMACLLGSHSEISTVGEFGSVFSEKLPCSCGKSFAECDFWKTWEDRASAAGFDFHVGHPGINLEPSHSGGRIEDLFYYQFNWKWLNWLRDIGYGPTSKLLRQTKTAINKSIWLARDLCMREDSKTFVDTTKNPYQIRFLARNRDIDLKVIVLVRDGRGVMNSMIQKEGWTPQQSIDSWLWANRLSERVVRMLPLDKVFRLRLEDLCREPDVILRQLLRFCGVNEQEKLDASILRSRHVIGNGMRLRFTGEIRLDEKWRQTLSEENQALFQRQAGWLNRKLGYTD